MIEALDRVQITEPSHRHYRSYAYATQVDGSRLRVQLEELQIDPFWLHESQVTLVPKLPQPVVIQPPTGGVIHPPTIRRYPYINLFLDESNVDYEGSIDMGDIETSESLVFEVTNTGQARLAIGFINLYI